MSNTPLNADELTDEQFVESLRTKLWLIYTAKSEDKAEVRIENAIESIRSTMTRNSRVKADRKKHELLGAIKESERHIDAWGRERTKVLKQELEKL